MDQVTVGTDTIERILHRYEPYLHDCRRYIGTRLRRDPAAAVLVRYFEKGKMLRALLVFIAASATGSEPSKMLMVGAALELLHGASLIHDDIVDAADTRRGMPALHVQVGIGPALVLGDYLILRSFAVLREAETVYEPYAVLGALHTLNHYAQACCLGEVYELLPSGQSDPEAHYLSVVKGKSAAPFIAAATLPAILAMGTLGEIEALRAYGLNLGIAFQIQDDVLDLIGDASILGKPVGLSLVKGRPMLPLIYLEREGSPPARREYRRLQQLEEGRAELVRLLTAEGIWERVSTTRDKYVSAAQHALDRLSPSEGTDALRVFASYATTHSNLSHNH